LQFHFPYLLIITAIDSNKEQMLSGGGVGEAEVEWGKKKKIKYKREKKSSSHFYIHKYAFRIQHETLTFVNTIVKRCCILCFTF